MDFTKGRFSKKINLKTYWLILLFVLFLSESSAQICTGALGDAIPNAGTNFGSNTPRFGQPIAETNYRFVAAIPEDGEYTIVKTTAGLNSGWHQNVVNHTPDDPNGYFMVINADFNQGVFYQKNISNVLCPNTTYEFAAYIINILRNPGIRPNVKFTIENNSVIIKEFSTSDIPEGNATDWIKYGTIFTTPANVGVITLKMTNQNPGGLGNDLALDDITFRPCGPIVNSSINNGGTTVNLCAGQSGTFELNADVSAFTDPVYQWQFFDQGTWKDVPGEIATRMTVTLSNAPAEVYKYRLAVAERINYGSINCRVSSTQLTINVNEKPYPIALAVGNICIGSDLSLYANGGVSYVWTGPNNFYSAEQNPIRKNISANDSGKYIVTATNASGCTNTTEVDVMPLPAIIGSTNISEGSICEGSAMQLEAYGGGTYKWTPITGLSDPNISNPTASPLTTTTYTVNISNGQCAVDKQLTITVVKSGKADAGSDKKLVSGQSVALSGSITSNSTNYYWTPTDYLDDPTKLNPIATPPNDITYTLHLSSDCGTSIDDVFVKVYPKIEIPNTFSPNQDGINDTWNIPAIVAYPNPRLTVMNRFGRVVFEGYKESVWDGKWKGKDVPAGTYYYTLYLDKSMPYYSGWLTVIR